MEMQRISVFVVCTAGSGVMGDFGEGMDME